MYSELHTSSVSDDAYVDKFSCGGDFLAHSEGQRLGVRQPKFGMPTAEKWPGHFVVRTRFLGAYGRHHGSEPELSSAPLPDLARNLWGGVGIMGTAACAGLSKFLRKLGFGDVLVDRSSPSRTKHERR